MIGVTFLAFVVFFLTEEKVAFETRFDFALELIDFIGLVLCLAPFFRGFFALGGPFFLFLRSNTKTKISKNKRSSVVLAAAALPALSFAADLDASAMTGGLDTAKTIVIAVGTAIFAIVGIIAAIRYAKRAAN